MKKTTLKKLTAFLVCLVFMLMPVLAFGQWDPLREQTTTNLADTPVAAIIFTFLKWLLLILTFLAVIGFVVSGILYVTAGGSSRAESAQKWMVNSIIGIVVGLLGYIVINFINTTLQGTVQTY